LEKYLSSDSDIADLMEKLTLRETGGLLPIIIKELTYRVNHVVVWDKGSSGSGYAIGSDG
jgi:hypothetical protein